MSLQLRGPSASALSATFVTQIGPSNGTDDTAWINSLLASGGAFKFNRGQNYKLSGPLVVVSNSDLDLAGVTFSGKAGWLGGNMLANYAAVNPQRTDTGASITAGSAVLTLPGGVSSADVGRSVVLPAGNPGATSTFTATILSVNTGTNTATLSTTAGATVTAGTAVIYTRDTNIHIRGSRATLFDRGGAAAPVNNNGQHSVYFRRVDGLTFEKARHSSTSGKYAISVGDCTDFTIEHHRFANSSDGVHVLGPASFGRIANLSGSTNDDFVALGCSDYATYADIQGDITDIEIDGIRPASAQRLLHLFGGSTGRAFTLARIKARGFYGNTLQSPILVEQGDSVTPVTVVDDITLADVMPTGDNNGPTVLFGSATGTTALGGVRIRNLHKNGSTETTDIIRVNTGVGMRRLDIDGLTLPGGLPTLGAVKLQGALQTLSIRGADAVLGTGAKFVSINAGALSELLLTDFAVSGVTTSSTPYLVNCSGANTLNIKAKGGRLTNFNGSYPWWLNGTVVLDMFGVNHGTCYQVIHMQGATTTVRVRGAGIDCGNTSNHPADGDAGSLCYSSTFDYQTDLAQATTGKALGDRAWNTNGALACGVGPVVCTGTGAAPNWKNLLSGATY